MSFPTLKRGDVLFSGNAFFDGEERDYHLVYEGYSDNRSIVPKDAIADIQRLGLEVSEHWNYRTKELGHMASERVRYKPGSRPVGLHVRAFLQGSITNQEVKHMLEAKY